MFEPSQIETLVRGAFNVDYIDVVDLTGTKDHYSMVVVSAEFAGTFPLKQHRMVNAALAEPLASGAIHALQLQTFTPEDWAKQK